VPKWTAVVLCFLPLVVFTACGAGNRIGVRVPSNNWSGYILDGHYARVSASWVQPSVNCSVAPTASSKFWEAASFWTGLDGYFGTDTVEQIGTIAICLNGRPSYRAWFQFYPAPSHTYSNLVKPGDKISASVTDHGYGYVALILVDRSEGWRHRVSAQSHGRPTSAEAIAEAQTPPQPYYSRTLADFGTVRFTGATADGKSFSDLNGLHPIDMVSNGKLKAAPSPIASGAFTVTWKHS